MIKYLELDKETLDIVAGPFEGPEVPVFANDAPLVAKEVISMPDPYIVDGQVWNDETSSVEDTQVSLNRKSQNYLFSTDWYLIREFETGKATPDDIRVKRQEARDSIIG